TLYFLLSNRVPFPEGSFTEKLLKHNMEEPRPLQESRPGLSEEVYAIVQKLMAKRPEDRYQTPADLAEALALLATPQRSAEEYRPKKEPAGSFSPTIIPSQIPLIRRGLSAMGRAPTDPATGSGAPAALRWQTLP